MKKSVGTKSASNRVPKREKKKQQGAMRRQVLQAEGLTLTRVCDLPGYEEISDIYYLIDTGKVWSDLKGGCRKPSATNADGYLQLGLQLKSGKQRTFYIHHLMAVWQCGHRPHADEEVRHLDGNKYNNSLGNLAYGTSKQNASDRIRHGRSALRYSDTQIRHVRGFGQLVGKTAKKQQTGLSKAKLMKFSGVASSAMDPIIRGKQRSEVPEIPEGFEGIIISLHSMEEITWTNDPDPEDIQVSPGEVLQALQEEDPEIWTALRGALLKSRC